jgi:curved DNA-binding protein
MEYKDYYKILGVTKGASAKEIKAAYRRLARKHHPDVNPGRKQAEARFKEINEANEVLSDPEKRRRYDQLGANWEAFGGQPDGAGTWPGARVRVEGFDDLGGFSDFFRTFFAGTGGAPAGFEEAFGRSEDLRAAAHVEHAVELTLEEVFRGTTRRLRMGERGREVEVKIPAGVREGSRVRVAGEGGAGPGGARGDLYLRVHVAPHARFERKGDDLQTTVAARLTTAVLGGELEVLTLEGRVNIKVPAGTPAGRVFRLRGQGLPRLEAGGGRGDLLATLSVELPKDLSGRERELFEELKRLGR